MELTARQIKIIGCVSMMFSHLGIIFFPYVQWWQIPGRIAMPIFAFMIANGARLSGNARRYAARLFIYALLVQYPYSIFLPTGHLNICFTLGLGLLAILIWQSPLPVQARAAAVLALALLAEFSGAEYGLYGLAMIFSAHLFFDNWRNLSICWLLLNVPYLVSGALTWAAGGYWPSVQGLCLLALPILRRYNGRRGGGSRWEFYIFYIGHLALLYGLRLWLWGY